VRGDALGLDAFAHEHIAHRGGATLGEPLVRFRRAAIVGEAFDDDFSLGMLAHEAREVAERPAAAGLDRGVARVEQEIAGERQDPAALGLARLQLRHLRLQAAKLGAQAIVEIARRLDLFCPRLRAIARLFGFAEPRFLALPLAGARMGELARDARALLGEIRTMRAFARRRALGLGERACGEL
jgi:hypothetical protein